MNFKMRLRNNFPISVTLVDALEDIGDPTNMKVKDSKSDDAAASRRFDVEGAISNGWLYLEDADLLELADDAGVSPEDGLTVSVRGDLASASKYKRHRSFGFCLCS